MSDFAGSLISGLGHDQLERDLLVAEVGHRGVAELVQPRSSFRARHRTASIRAARPTAGGTVHAGRGDHPPSAGQASRPLPCWSYQR